MVVRLRIASARRENVRSPLDADEGGAAKIARVEEGEYVQREVVREGRDMHGTLRRIHWLSGGVSAVENRAAYVRVRAARSTAIILQCECPRGRREASGTSDSDGLAEAGARREDHQPPHRPCANAAQSGGQAGDDDRGRRTSAMRRQPSVAKFPSSAIFRWRATAHPQRLRLTTRNLPVRCGHVHHSAHDDCRFRVILIETCSTAPPAAAPRPPMHARQASLAETGISEDTLPVQIEVRADVRPRRALTPPLEGAAHPTTHRRVLLAARDRREARARFAIIRQMSANIRRSLMPLSQKPRRTVGDQVRGGAPAARPAQAPGLEQDNLCVRLCPTCDISGALACECA